MSENASPQNLLRHETSPYLLQHADNPVHWRGWNPAALAEAERLDRPILLSIGYAACHWCHVMAHESFEDAATADLMNALFVNIKVDREERPDIDQIYMAALHALGDQGGWPLTMFLTPAGKPIWGGTYFPKTSRYGRPGFSNVLRQVSELYHADRDAILEQSNRITAHLSRARAAPAQRPLDTALLDQAADAILGIMDHEHGGTKGAPKFPNVPVLDFLARSVERTGRADLRQIVETTLGGLSNGGIFDHIGGGFARYSTDAVWLVPHFEKMLSDNGLLLDRLARAIPVSDQADLFRDRIETTIGWLQREMLLPEGGFAASLDADSEGHEGRFYVWQRHELDEALTAADAGFFASLYDITADGNWEGTSIPNRLHPHPPLTKEEDRRRRRILDDLRAYRSHRIRPGLDDKLLVDWTAHAIAGLATAAMILDRPEWLALAEAAYTALQTTMVDARPPHATRAGKSIRPAFSSDLTALARAAISLHQATQRRGYLKDAIHLLDLLDSHYTDGRGGFYFTADDADPLIQRRNDRFDDAVPNPHGMAADSLVRLWSLTGNPAFRERADAILESSAADIAGNVFGTASLLSALDLRLRVVSIVIIVPEATGPGALCTAVRNRWRSNFTLDVRSEGEALPVDHPAHGKSAIGKLPTAYVCREGSCSLPVFTTNELVLLLQP